MEAVILTCPCCEGVFEQFKPFGLRPRPNAQCPGCGALERHRLLWLYLKERTALFDGEERSMLHVAPENVLQQKFRAIPALEYVSADLDSPLAAERIDITSIPRPDATFDVIMCNHVLEHVPDDRRAMRELWRVLRAGGWAILQVPIDSGLAVTREDSAVTDPRERERLFGQADHVRLYGRDYRDRLEAAGFTVTCVPFFAELPEQTRLRHALADEDIYCCVKSAR